MRYTVLPILLFSLSCSNPKPAGPAVAYSEPHRPQIHFSPKQHWMNDPNGMIFYDNTWHLFFQYYPDSTVWGPMHWGHATSTDLVHWKEQPVALYPDSLGYIFSGSVIADTANTSGFGKEGKTPLIAIFTQHDPVGEKQGRIDFQRQGIAYSLDEGTTWTKYIGNPVLKNPGIKDFRDPKVAWNEKVKKWIMTLATKDRVSFYSSPDCRQWTKESAFGATVGAHGGVWECPDLFPINDNGKTVWVLLVSINPGGPQGGSATQYFIGDFDGKQFTSSQKEIRWIDAGTDDYAGVTWSNTGDRHIFMGWMSNWQYAQAVPTKQWRSAMTIPRELSLTKVKGQYYLRSVPVKELDALGSQENVAANLTVLEKELSGPAKLHIQLKQAESFSVTLSNAGGEKWVAGFDADSNYFFIDRTLSGEKNFEKGFASRITSRRIDTASGLDLTLIIDNASAELFADSGLTTMTSIFFPKDNYTRISIKGNKNFRMKTASLIPLKPIWDN